MHVHADVETSDPTCGPRHVDGLGQQGDAPVRHGDVQPPAHRERLEVLGPRVALGQRRQLPCEAPARRLAPQPKQPIQAFARFEKVDLLPSQVQLGLLIGRGLRHLVELADVPRVELSGREILRPPRWRPRPSVGTPRARPWPGP